jgi:molybdate transport system regulatory protein
MKVGALNQLKGQVTEVRKGDIMAQVKFKVTADGNMASVLTTESVESLGLKVGDTVTLYIKAVHVLPVKE